MSYPDGPPESWTYRELYDDVRGALINPAALDALLAKHGAQQPNEQTPAATYVHVSSTSDTPAPKQQAAAASAAAARLAEAALARRAWKAVEPDMPQIIADAKRAGRKPRDIARDLDTGDSYVYRILREQRAAVEQ
ncbi:MULTISPECIES: hypothetical protein [Streptomyces]|uniref:Helix-turn-helix DNA binding domain protein n=1 Tax=Streptomyces dengpaensis TaxID=2049881 RepID=A0ABM6SVG0_9ACTN|nr:MULTISPECIES: hypothetical protein [Streptomyces]AVH58395.1 hypothetical protein C4B68_24445 [Streptomyces dengpaensis]PIB06070.1 hypothetical protein B1C81_26165 [Streptomyces sp. HG99]